MSETRQEKDLELWKEWRKTRDPATLSKLLDRLHPLIIRETGKWQASVPQAALEAKARMLTVEALESYNPNMGAAIGTHVTSRLRKLSRSVYPYQNVARLPENKQLLFNTFQVAQNNLLDQHGREPTTEELADELRWTPKRVADFQRSFGRRELVESEGAFIEDDHQESQLVDFYYHGLPPEDKLLFEHIVGYGGKKVLSNTELNKKFRISQGQLSYKKRKFVDDLKRIQRGGV
jgi:DNA-directed RNA polymerase specialized sigma subunit